MKLKWDLPGFNLNLENMWNIGKGPIPSANLNSISECAIELKTKIKSKIIGFYDWPIECPANEIEMMKKLALETRSRYDGALLFGIGGSYLGAASLLQALRLPDEEIHFPLHWLSNVDKTSITRAQSFISKNNLASVLISKSGNTTETLSGFYHFSQALDQKGITVITDPIGGELRKLSQKNNWNTFTVPQNIGGRFSVLTSVGLFPLLLGGIDVDLVLSGAKKMRMYLEELSPDENPAYLFAYSKFLWDQIFDHPIQYLMPYESGLQLFGDWYVQLWGESLGKLTTQGHKHVGPTPVAALGTTDQHSLLQLFKEGPRNKLVGFIDLKPTRDTEVGKSIFASSEFDFLCDHSFEEINHLACLATEKSLQNSSVPTYRVELPCLNPETLGALVFFMQTACAFSGELYGVDAFNQPGVEEVKKLLRASL